MENRQCPYCSKEMKEAPEFGKGWNKCPGCGGTNYATNRKKKVPTKNK